MIRRACTACTASTASKHGEHGEHSQQARRARCAQYGECRNCSEHGKCRVVCVASVASRGRRYASASAAAAAASALATAAASSLATAATSASASASRGGTRGRTCRGPCACCPSAHAAPAGLFAQMKRAAAAPGGWDHPRRGDRAAVIGPALSEFFKKSTI